MRALASRSRLDRHRWYCVYARDCMCQWSAAAKIGLDQVSLSFKPLWCTMDQVLVSIYLPSTQVDETKRSIYDVHRNPTPQASETGHPSLAHTSYNGILKKNQVFLQLSQCIYVYPSFLLLNVYGFTRTILSRCCTRPCNLDQVDTNMVSNCLPHGGVEKSHPSS